MNGTGLSQVNCPFGLSGTNYCKFCDPEFYLVRNECFELEQVLFYKSNRLDSKIYKYGITYLGDGVFLNEFESPNGSQWPYLVYNTDLDVLEIIGDYNEQIEDHYHMLVREAEFFNLSEICRSNSIQSTFL